MKRYAYKNDGVWTVNGSPDCITTDTDGNYIGGAIDRLAAYEGTDMSPSDVEKALIILERIMSGTHGHITPKTNADLIRASSDEQLADMITMLMSRQRAMILKQLRVLGLIPDVCTVEAPIITKAAHLEWLRDPIKGKEA